MIGTTTEGPVGTLHVFATGSVTGPLRRAAQAFVLLHDGVSFEFTAAGAGKLLPRMLEWQEVHCESNVYPAWKPGTATWQE